jgi:ferredoxin
MQIKVDPIMCEAHGLCAELLPERITLDEWGYPLIDDTPIPPALLDLARRAVDVCPTLALRLQAVVDTERVAGHSSPQPTGTHPEERPYKLYSRGRPR